MGNGASRQFVGLISQSSYETRTPLRDPLREDLLSLFEHVETVYTGWRKRKEDDLEKNEIKSLLRALTACRNNE